MAHWVNEFFGLKGEERISKIKVHKVARWVMDQKEQQVVLRLSVMSNWRKKFRNLCLMPGKNIETTKGSDQLFGSS